jgi:2-dehydro-3-deoxy-D-arabinonate dehydratase
MVASWEERHQGTIHMKIYKTPIGLVANQAESYRLLSGIGLTDLLTASDAMSLAKQAWERGSSVAAPTTLLAPIDGQEVWAAGVTYYRSRVARMEESKAAGGGSFYDRVYDAPRPELFFKSTAARVANPGAAMRLRRDSKWMVPEPELALVINNVGKIIGYTVGNDLSARDLEGENPLYLPQAKTWDTSACVGPGWLLTEKPLAGETQVKLQILREGLVVNEDSTTLAQMKRTPEELVGYLFEELSFPTGCLMMTGTGIVPPDNFTLLPGDVVRISIDPIGTLENVMTSNPA